MLRYLEKGIVREIISRSIGSRGDDVLMLSLLRTRPEGKKSKTNTGNGYEALLGYLEEGIGVEMNDELFKMGPEGEKNGRVVSCCVFR